MAGYSGVDKFLHRFYLSNYGISRATLEMEEIMHGPKARQWEVSQAVFVTGLARSGTTAVMNKLFGTGEYASLQYSNMPFLLCPNLWKRKAKIEAHERAHSDGIIIDGNSPEEFDEYFWKAILNDRYMDKEGMHPHDIPEDILKKYQTYMALICLAKGKHKYISKNNNNILRLEGLQKIPNARIIFLFRDPVAHASSLMKLDAKFTVSQEEDPFTLSYFNYLGHHEFGKNHKPFLLTDEFRANRQRYNKADLNYWLSIWQNYYSYLLTHAGENAIFISFEDLIRDPNGIYKFLSKELELESPLADINKHEPSKYAEAEYDQKLLQKCRDTYGKLFARTAY